jgi:hypothetical protein
MEFKIIEKEKSEYTILLEGKFFRHCQTYSELENTINFLIKSKFKKNAECFI